MPRAREVIALALPALGALAAEPLYVLGDTAIVGHLGRVPLAGLAIAGMLLSEIVGLCTFLEYGTTAKAARLYGAGAARRRRSTSASRPPGWRSRSAPSARWLLELAAGPALRLIAGSNDSASLHAGADLVPHRRARRAVHARDRRRAGLAARVPGHAHGLRRARAPRTSRASRSRSTLIRGFGLGIEGSAIANVVSQVAAAAVFVRAARAPRPDALAPSWQRMLPQLRAARDLGLRSLAFTAAFLLAASVAARMGDAQVAAHQIGFQLWIFVALVLDSVAIAAQALIGRLLGAGAVDAARRLARRLLVAGARLRHRRRRALRGRVVT